MTIYNHPSFGDIRTDGTAEQPWFCLADICRVLELQTGATKNRLNQRGIILINTPTTSGEQQMLFIDEQNLYKVIMRSDKPQAEQFQDWVCGEVLPSIRKHGAYMTEKVIERTLSDPDYLIQLATTLKEEKQARLEAEQRAEYLQAKSDAQGEKIALDAPKVAFANAVTGSRGSILIGEMAKILKQHGVKNMGQNRFFAWLREHGYLLTRGEYYNLPAQKYVEMGIFEIKKGIRTGEGGNLHETTTTKVTGKGQVYFLNKFKSQ